MNEPQISVVVTAYNAAPFLGATLDSIRAQTFQAWECLVIDDGSTDATPQIARDYAARDNRIRALTQENGGVSSARNLGYQQANAAAPFIIWMDGDDCYRPDALQRLVEAATAHPKAAGAHGLADWMDENGQPLQPGAFAEQSRRRKRFNGREIVNVEPGAPTDFPTLIVGYWMYPPGLVLCRREAIEVLKPRGLWDLEMGRRGATGEDWDFYTRLSRWGEFRFVDEVLVDYRRHTNNISNSARTNAVWANVARWKMHQSSENTPEHKALLRKLYRPLQAAKMREKLYWSKRYAREGRRAEQGKMLAHLAALGLRWLRGFPTRRG